MRTSAGLRELVDVTTEAVKDAPADIRASLAGALLTYLLGSPKRQEPETPRGERPGPALRATLGETVAAARSQSHPDRLVLTAAHAFLNEATESMTTGQFIEAYRALRVARPQNLHANIASCVKRGWFVDAPPRDGRKAWRITQTGIQHAEELLAEVNRG